MAASLGRMLRPYCAFVDSSRVCGRHFASKIKQPSQKNVSVKHLFEKQKSSAKAGNKKTEATNSYQALMNKRHEEASRSVLIRIQHAAQSPSVCASLQTVGPIKHAFTFTKVKDYLLVEFEHKEAVERLLQHVSYFPDTCQVPVRSRMLYAMRSSLVQRHDPPKMVKPELIQARDLVLSEYMAAANLSAQMEDLHSVRRLSDAGSRLRYFVCSAVEDLLRTVLPFCRVDPFGSSSNGFGWEGCDLDMMLTLMASGQHTDQNAKFQFLTKRGSEDERVFGQQCLDTVGEIIRGMMPSTRSVFKVLNARVPIIKFHHEMTEIDCDLSIINVSGTKMSELMYLLSEIDPRVPVLMTTIKQWAKSCEVTRNHPGPWPANFTLLAMLIMFLQSRTVPVLPPLRHLQSLAAPQDHFMIDGIDYSFVTDVSKVKKSKNSQSLEDLLQEFFHYYVHVDFSTQGLSLIEGAPFSKLDSSPLYIENPLEVGHNISKNVTADYVTRLQNSMLEALRCLEAKSKPSSHEPWGIMCLFAPPLKFQASSSLNVMGLFQEDADASDKGGVAKKVPESPLSETVDSKESTVSEKADSKESTVSEKESTDSGVTTESTEKEGPIVSGDSGVSGRVHTDSESISLGVHAHKVEACEMDSEPSEDHSNKMTSSDAAVKVKDTASAS